jgi:hypothetical protein
VLAIDIDEVGSGVGLFAIFELKFDVIVDVKLDSDAELIRDTGSQIIDVLVCD